MPIIAKDTGGAAREPSPAGTWPAICMDVVDLGMREKTYPGQAMKLVHEVRIVWQLDVGDEHDLPESGEPFFVSAWYTLSLHEKAKLRHDLETWRGKAFSPDELKGFDLEKLIHVPAVVTVIHKQRQDGGISDRVNAVTKPLKGMKAPVPWPDYVRVSEREAQEQAATDQDAQAEEADEIPF